MESITLTLIGITMLFFVLLALKSLLKSKKICAICSSVALTWIVLLVLYFTDIFTDRLIIAILMGMSSLGMYYMWEKKVKERNLIFRLPVILTFIFIVYSILNGLTLNGLYFVIGVWVFFALIYLFKFNKFAKQLIECCKKW